MVVAAATLLAGVVASFAWGIVDISTEVDRVVASGVPSQVSAGFNLKDAANLNLKGLVQD